MSLPVLQAPVPGGPELVIILFILFASLVIPLAVAVLVYRDASGRGSSHALAWGLGAFFGGLVVWILYFFVRDEVRGSGVA